MTEYRRILLDGNVVEVTRDGENLVAGDGRTDLPSCDGARWHDFVSAACVEV
jgi:hypothetical protein